jgi:ABC-type arginine transport system permease subunit
MARDRGPLGNEYYKFYVDRMAELLNLHIRKSAFMLLEVNLIVLVCRAIPGIVTIGVFFYGPKENFQGLTLVSPNLGYHPVFIGLMFQTVG